MTLEMQDAGGITALTTGTVFWIIDKISIGQINDFIIMATAAVGFIWTVYKAINARLDAKIKKRQLEKDIEEGRE